MKIILATVAALSFGSFVQADMIDYSVSCTVEQTNVLGEPSAPVIIACAQNGDGCNGIANVTVNGQTFWIGISDSIGTTDQTVVLNSGEFGKGPSKRLASFTGELPKSFELSGENAIRLSCSVSK